MRVLCLVGLMMASACWAQDPASNSQQPPTPDHVQAPAADQNQPQNASASATIVIPAGTRIPLALASPVTKKAARAGTAIRAVTGFPVTVGTQLAIPAGTYVVGVIDSVTRGGRWGPSMQMHFTRLVYSNGYSVPMDGTSTQAQMLSPELDSPELEPVAFTVGNMGSYALVAQQSPPPLPPLPPSSGPHFGPVIALGVGGAVVAIISTVLFARHSGGSNFVLFDTGWQFAMVLQNPLSVDAASVGTAR